MDGIEDPVVQGDHPEHQPPPKWTRRRGKKRSGNQERFPEHRDNRQNNNSNRRFQNYNNQSNRPFHQVHGRDGNPRPNSRGGYRRMNQSRETKPTNNDSNPTESSEILLETGGVKITSFSKSYPVIDDAIHSARFSSMEFPPPFPTVKSTETTSESKLQVSFDFDKVESDHQHTEQVSPTDEGIGIPVATSSRNSSLSTRHSSGDDKESHVDADRSTVSGYCSGVTEKTQETQAESCLAFSSKSTSLADVCTDLKNLTLESRSKKHVETVKNWDSKSPKELQHKTADIPEPEGNVNVKAPPGFGKPFKNNNQKSKRGRGDHKFYGNRQWSKKHNKDLEKNPSPSPVSSIYPPQPQPFHFPILQNFYQQQALNLASKGHLPTRPVSLDPNLIKKLEQSLTPKPLQSFQSTVPPHTFHPTNLYNRNFPAGDQKLQQRQNVSNIKDTASTLQQAKTPSWQPTQNYNTQTHYGPPQFQNSSSHQNCYFPKIPQTQHAQNSPYNVPGSRTCQGLENDMNFGSSRNIHPVFINAPSSLPPYVSFPPPPPPMIPIQGQSPAFTPHPFLHSTIHHFAEPDRYHVNGTVPRNQSQIQYFPSATAAANGEVQYHWMPSTSYQHVLPVPGDGFCVPYLVPSIYPDPAIHRVIGPLTIDTRLAEDPSNNPGPQSSLTNDLLAVATPLRYETGGNRQ